MECDELTVIKWNECKLMKEQRNETEWATSTCWEENDMDERRWRRSECSPSERQVKRKGMDELKQSE